MINIFIVKDVCSHQDLEEVAQEGQRCPEEVQTFTSSVVKCWEYGVLILDLDFSPSRIQQ
jgi:hypothetical protein